MAKFFRKKGLTNGFFYDIITVVPEKSGAKHGGIAQLARALGSYPNGRWFKSDFRYHAGPLVKRLRHGPFTAVTWVRFPYGSPKQKSHTIRCGIFVFAPRALSAQRGAKRQTYIRSHYAPRMGTRHCSAASVSEALHGGANSRTGHQKQKSTTQVVLFCFSIIPTVEPTQIPTGFEWFALRELSV